MAAALKIRANHHADDHVWVAEGTLDDVSIVTETETYEALRESVADAVAIAAGGSGVTWHVALAAPSTLTLSLSRSAGEGTEHG